MKPLYKALSKYFIVAMVWMVVTPNSYVENQMSKEMVLGGGALGRWLEREGRTHMKVISGLIKEIL